MSFRVVMPEYKHNLRHIHLLNNGQPEVYTYPKGGGGRSSYPYRNRKKHADFLWSAYETALDEFESSLLKNEELGTEEQGIYVEFLVDREQKEALEKLENSPKRIELVAVKESEDGTNVFSATVFIPEKAKDFFSDKIKAYRDEDTPNKGNPKNEALVACLENIKLSTVRTIFTDDINSFPEENQTVWWEVWLRRGGKDDFLSVAEQLEIRTQEHTIVFPDREVLLALCNVAKLSQIIINTSSIAELRLAKDNPSVFFEMRALEQRDWVDEMSGRIIPSTNQIAVCLLDYGVNRTHKLIQPALRSSDLLTYDPNCIPVATDLHGHGTNMAAIALYGNLFAALTSSNQYNLTIVLSL